MWRNLGSVKVLCDYLGAAYVYSKAALKLRPQTLLLRMRLKITVDFFISTVFVRERCPDRFSAHA